MNQDEVRSLRSTPVMPVVFLVLATILLVVNLGTVFLLQGPPCASSRGSSSDFVLLGQLAMVRRPQGSDQPADAGMRYPVQSADVPS